jgi:hypothetical protein
MFKLVGVGGRLRGQEFILEEGENIVGRGVEANIQLNIEGISKKHLRITVNQDTIFLEDLGSSNGTFVNGKIIKKVTAKNGDKLALPNVIFQVVYVEEKKIIIKKKIAKDDEHAESYKTTEQMPDNFPGKIKYLFKHKFMTLLYGFNKEYEWRVIIAILLFAFITVNIGLIISPILTSYRKILIYEIASRGTQFANEVARTNAAALGRRDLDQLDTSFLDNEAEGVQSYELYDLEGRIVRPLGKLNTYVNDAFSVDALRFYKGEGRPNDNFTKMISTSEIGIAKAILAHDMRSGRQETVGIIAIRFKPKSIAIEAKQSSGAYLESLVMSALLAIIFFGMIYYLTLKPLEDMRTQIDEVLRGKKKEVEKNLMMEELNPIRTSVNGILLRIKELQNDDSGEFNEVEEDGKYVEALREFMLGAQGAAMIMNSEKLIQAINTEAEDLTGIRENAAVGMSLLDSARDQGFAATLIDLCDQSANNEGRNQSEVYEIGGRNWRINITSLIGKDNFAKAFYVTFVGDD